MSVGTYGAGTWGFANVNALELVESNFLRQLLAVPSCIPSALCHEEVGAPYLIGYLKVAPLLLWHSVWAKEETHLNQAIIQDCLALDKSNSILWVSYVKDTLTKLDFGHLFLNPSSCRNISIKQLRGTFFSACIRKRDLNNMKKPSVRTYFHQAVFSGP